MNRTVSAAAIALMIVAPFAASAQKLGDHPAIVVQRVQASAGYDYQSKFYPHPAWLYLSAEAPRPMSDHPAVMVARREQERRAAEQREAEAPQPVEPTSTQAALTRN